MMTPLTLPRRVLLAAVGLLTACSGSEVSITPAEPEVAEAPCTVLPPPPVIQTGNTELQEYPIIQSVRYNPLDAQEIACVLIERVQPGNFLMGRLYRINLRTRQRTLLVQNPGDNFDWNRNGWVVFTQASDIWKIKANGDSLTRLTTAGGGGSPSWSRDGRRIAYLRFTTNRNQNGLYVVSATGQPLQFVPDARIRTGSPFALSPDGQRVAVVSDRHAPGSGQMRFGVYDLRADSLATLFNLPPNQYGSGFDWTADSRHIVWAATSVRETDPGTGITRTVREACAPDDYGRVTRFYYSPSLSPDEQRILMVTCRRRLGSDGVVYIYTRLQTTDRNGQHIQDVAF